MSDSNDEKLLDWVKMALVIHPANFVQIAMEIAFLLPVLKWLGQVEPLVNFQRKFLAPNGRIAVA